jgi:rfaE bifunctional protein nucleotidyltransferase chain/domain
MNEFSLQKAVQAREEARNKGRIFTLTNGCFDVLHAGHAFSLNKASELGDLLFVGLNSDKSVKKIKGNQRPINSEDKRAYLLNSLQAVDGVFMFENQNLAKEILLLEPDIYTKSDDYNYENINAEERDALRKVGAQVHFVPLVKDLSSSSIIEKMKDQTI